MTDTVRSGWEVLEANREEILDGWVKTVPAGRSPAG